MVIAKLLKLLNALKVVAGDFDYGTITANSYNLNVDGDFSYDDAANDFVLGLNDTLTVLGSANIVAADFANSGTIAVTGSFGITAAGFDNSSIIRASSIFNVTVGDFINRAGATITAAECNFVHDSFTDEGTITCLNSNTVDTTVTANSIGIGYKPQPTTSAAPPTTSSSKQ